LSKNTLSLQRLREAVEVAKIELSSITETEINLPFISADSSGTPKHLKMKISRAKYNQLIEPLVNVCPESINDSRVFASNLVVLLLQPRPPLCSAPSLLAKRA
jgi:molecular chaperone DnaK